MCVCLGMIIPHYFMYIFIRFASCRFARRSFKGAFSLRRISSQRNSLWGFEIPRANSLLRICLLGGEGLGSGIGIRTPHQGSGWSPPPSAGLGDSGLAALHMGRGGLKAFPPSIPVQKNEAILPPYRCCGERPGICSAVSVLGDFFPPPFLPEVDLCGGCC